MSKANTLLLLVVGLVLILAACSSPPVEPGDFTLSVTVVGNGVVSSNPAGADCSSDTCTADFDSGASVTLTATPDEGATFTGWTGACQGTGTCQVTMDSDQSVTATFEGGEPGEGFTLAVTVTGNGTVTGDGIDCPGDCGATFEEGGEVTLTATPDSGATFTGWGGACSGSETTCTFTLSSNATVTAAFEGGGTEFPAGTMFLDSGDLELNYDSSNGGFHQLVGVRFVPILPTGVTAEDVTSAVIQFTADAGSRAPLTVQIAAQDAPNPGTFTTTANDISSRPLTSSVSWTVEGWGSDFDPTVQGATPDLSGLLTEAGWTSGNAVVFVIEGDDSDNQRSAASFDGDEAEAPVLVITYGAGQTYEVGVAQSSDDAEENLEAFSNLNLLLD